MCLRLWVSDMVAMVADVLHFGIKSYNTVTRKATWGATATMLPELLGSEPAV